MTGKREIGEQSADGDRAAANRAKGGRESRANDEKSKSIMAVSSEFENETE